MPQDDPGYIHYQGDFNRYQGQFLPHWDVEDGIYFVTFRLYDSLPEHVAQELNESYRRRLSTLVDTLDASPDTVDDFRLDFFLNEIDPRLDDHRGACHLRKPKVAEVVRDSLLHFDGQRFDMYAWAIIPNHVHVLFGRRPDHPLGDVVGGWKSHTSHVARDMVEFGDHFWLADYFDRLIRSEREFRNVAEYITQNAEAAGLSDWQWQDFVRMPGDRRDIA